MLSGGVTLAGRYRVVELLGEGGMGQVWRGVDVRLERPVAVKVLSPHLLDQRTRHRMMVRFQREGLAAARVSHRNVAAVHDVGEHNEQPYLVMEFLDGRDLKDVLAGRSGGLPIGQVLDYGAQAAEGLAAAHAAGIVHRDLKPANLMLLADGTVKLCDFGIARLDDATAGLTGNNAIGTMAYMPPEQIMGKDVDHRTDLYSLGATLFHLLTGRYVFTGDVRAMAGQHLAADPPPARTVRADTPLLLEALLDTLLAKEPDRRPPDAATAAERLRDLWLPVLDTAETDRLDGIDDSLAARAAVLAELRSEADTPETSGTGDDSEVLPSAVVGIEVAEAQDEDNRASGPNNTDNVATIGNTRNNSFVRPSAAPSRHHTHDPERGWKDRRWPERAIMAGRAALLLSVAALPALTWLFFDSLTGPYGSYPALWAVLHAVMCVPLAFGLIGPLDHVDGYRSIALVRSLAVPLVAASPTGLAVFLFALLGTGYIGGGVATLLTLGYGVVAFILALLAAAWASDPEFLGET